MKKIILLATALVLVGCNKTTANLDNVSVSLPEEPVGINLSENNEEEETSSEEEVSNDESANTSQEETSNETEDQDDSDQEDSNQDLALDLSKTEILWLQESLKIAGFYTARDGDYGPKTQKALKSFQASLGLETTTYDTKTKISLENIRDKRLAPNYKTDLVLLNKNYYLPADFVPEGLREVNVDKNKYMELPDRIALIVEQMFADAEADGIHIVLASAYRSYDYQEGIFSRRVARNGFAEAETVVAIPGESEHQTGLAIDITSQAMGFGLGQNFEDDPAFEWMMDNCYKYGFILRYLKGREDDTGYVYEPWHYRYIGDPTIAEEIMKNEMILEEYFE